jgi:hypothetical protein
MPNKLGNYVFRQPLEFYWGEPIIINPSPLIHCPQTLNTFATQMPEPGLARGISLTSTFGRLCQSGSHSGRFLRKVIDYAVSTTPDTTLTLQVLGMTIARKQSVRLLSTIRNRGQYAFNRVCGRAHQAQLLD